MSAATHSEDHSMQGGGFYLDVPPWQAAVFSMTRGA
jgi:hypothetical protein